MLADREKMEMEEEKRKMVDQRKEEIILEKRKFRSKELKRLLMLMKKVESQDELEHSDEPCTNVEINKFNLRSKSYRD